MKRTSTVILSPVNIETMKPKCEFELLNGIYNVLVCLFGAMFLPFYIFIPFAFFFLKNTSVEINDDHIKIVTRPFWASKRVKAIAYALWFGILPWQWYEKECHYKGMTYLQHLSLNLKYALRWILFRETANDRKFEETINGSNAAKPSFREQAALVMQLRKQLLNISVTSPDFEQTMNVYFKASLKLRRLAEKIGRLEQQLYKSATQR